MLVFCSVRPFVLTSAILGVLVHIKKAEKGFGADFLGF